jgi:hypothetical protein
MNTQGRLEVLLHAFLTWELGLESGQLHTPITLFPSASLAYNSTMQMEAVRSFETTVNIYKATNTVTAAGHSDLIYKYICSV